MIPDERHKILANLGNFKKEDDGHRDYYVTHKVGTTGKYTGSSIVSFPPGEREVYRVTCKLCPEVLGYYYHYHDQAKYQDYFEPRRSVWGHMKKEHPFEWSISIVDAQGNKDEEN